MAVNDEKTNAKPETDESGEDTSSVLGEIISDLKSETGMSSELDGLTETQQIKILRALKSKQAKDAVERAKKATKNQPIVPNGDPSGGRSPFQGRVEGDRINWSIPVTSLIKKK